MRVRSKYWLEDDSGEVVFGEGRRKMLELIDELGSMQSAAKALGMSYRGVWARIKATEERLGMSLIETSVGRGKNRGSRLTPEAKKLLQGFKVLARKGIVHTDEVFDAVFHGGTVDIAPTVPVVAVAGLPGSGRSALIECLVREFTGRGLRAAVMSKDDSAGKEHGAAEGAFEAGSRYFLEMGTRRLVLEYPAEKDEDSPESLAANYAPGAKVVFYKTGQRVKLPTLEVFRSGLADTPLTRRRRDLLALVGDVCPDKPDWPHYADDDISGLADLVQKEVLVPSREEIRLELLVDGRKVPMLPFVQAIFENALVGMVNSLKNCEDPREIDLKIRRG